MPRILVVGGSAGIGLRTVVLGRARQLDMRPFSRHTEDPLGMRGDARSSEAIDAALDGVDAVVQTLGVPLDRHLLTGPITLFSHATEVLLERMQARQVQRLVTVTGFGAGTSASRIHPLQRPVFNLVFGHAYRDKTLQESLIKNSRLAWTLVRPTVLTGAALRRDYKVLYESTQWRNGWISRDSVADYILRALADDSTLYREPVLA